jgi:hypothetical protein
VDILNEPDIQDPATAIGADYTAVFVGSQELGERVIAAARVVHPERVFVWEPGMVAHPSQFHNRQPLTAENVVYSPHVYQPEELTHDQIGAYLSRTAITPTQSFDAAAQAALQEAITQFATSIGDKPILVGEFSCVRWALNEGASKYIAAAILGFEARGASYCYHEFASADPWDAEGPVGVTQDYVRSNDAPVAKVLIAALARRPRPPNP